MINYKLEPPIRNTNIFSKYLREVCGLAGGEKELAKSVEHLDKVCTAYGMEISAEKTKLMTNNTSGINKEIRVNGQKLETITSFKYLGSVVSDRVPSLR